MADYQGIVEVKLRTSTPTISLHDGTDFRLILELRLASNAQEGRPVTICLDDTCFQQRGPNEGGFNPLSEGAFHRLERADDSTGRPIRLGGFRVNRKWTETSNEMRERKAQLLTIPADGSSVTVSHALDWPRMFRYAERVTKDDLKPGDRLKTKIEERYLRTDWWCWGDLEGDLKDKKLHYWTPDYISEPKPDDDFVRDGNWVLGKESRALGFEDKTEGGWAVFEVAE